MFHLNFLTNIFLLDSSAAGARSVHVYTRTRTYAHAYCARELLAVRTSLVYARIQMRGSRLGSCIRRYITHENKVVSCKNHGCLGP